MPVFTTNAQRTCPVRGPLVAWMREQPPLAGVAPASMDVRATADAQEFARRLYALVTGARALSAVAERIYEGRFETEAVQERAYGRHGLEWLRFEADRIAAGARAMGRFVRDMDGLPRERLLCNVPNGVEFVVSLAAGLLARVPRAGLTPCECAAAYRAIGEALLAAIGD